MILYSIVYLVIGWFLLIIATTEIERLFMTVILKIVIIVIWPIACVLIIIDFYEDTKR